MTLITRYVVLELLKVFLVALIGLTLLMILIGIGQQALREGLGPGPTLRLIPFMLPNALRFAVPGTILFATCAVFGRMAASNEILALQTQGISPLVPVGPALALAFLLSLLAVWLNDVAVSWGNEGVKRVVMHSLEEITYGMLRTHGSFSNSSFSIIVKRLEGRKLISPTFNFHSNGVSLTASEAELRFVPERESLSIQLRDCEFEWGDDTMGVLPETVHYEVPLSKAFQHLGSSRAADLPLRRIPGTVQERGEAIERLEQTLAAEAGYQLLSGQLESLAEPKWVRQQNELRQLRRSISRLHTEPWRRWATGFSCFFFVLIGAPLAIRLKTADIWTTFGLCFLPILLLYYPLLAIGLGRAKSGDLPPVFVWLANLVLAVIGGWLLHRLRKR